MVEKQLLVIMGMLGAMIILMVLLMGCFRNPVGVAGVPRELPNISVPTPTVWCPGQFPTVVPTTVPNDLPNITDPGSIW